MTKKIIEVLVGTPKLENHGFEYIEIYNTEYLSIEYSSLDSVIKEANRLKRKYGKDYSDLCFVARRNCGCFHSCDCKPSMLLKGKRLETNLEYDFRMKKETEKEIEQLKRDRAMYETLQRKFANEEKKNA